MFSCCQKKQRGKGTAFHVSLSLHFIMYVPSMQHRGENTNWLLAAPSCWAEFGMACPEYKTEKSPCSTSTVDGWISEACLLFCSASQPGEVIWRLIAEGEERGCGEDPSSPSWPRRTLLSVMLLTHSLTPRKSLSGPNCPTSKSWITLYYLLQEHINRFC